jgi:argininosuccinate lyase
MGHLWSGRFAAEPDADLVRFGASFAFDRRLFEDDVKGSLAWAEALAAAGVLTAHDAAEIRSGLESLLRSAEDPDFFDSDAARGDEDVHAFVERELVLRIGEPGRRLHTGRSRNEQVALDMRLYLKRRVPLLIGGVRELIAALADQAEDTADAVMPSYTHLRRAQPVLVAHMFLAHAAAFRRDVDRLAGVLSDADVLPLGSGAIAGTSYPIDVHALAARLGFTAVVTNSVDATGDRDFVANFLYACALLMVHASRMAEDFILFSSEEFGFFDLADATATGSSLMPQKKNPDPLELVRGKAGRVIGRLTGLLATMHALPIGYSKDLQEDKEAMFDAEDTAGASLRALTAVTRGLTLNRSRAEEGAGGLLMATDVADYLVAKGMPFRDAHEVTGALVARLVSERRAFDSLTPEEWRSHHPLFGEDVRAWITPQASIARKRTPQSTAPAAVANALDELRSWLTAG